MWLTTADVARVLDVSTRWVRWLARQGELPCEVTEAGQRIYRRADVRQALIARVEAQARSQASRLRIVRVRMLKAGFEPRQQSLFGPRLRLVPALGRERPDPDAEVKGARSGLNPIGAEKPRYVDRKRRA